MTQLKSLSILVLAGFMIITAQSCKSYYIHQDFDAKTTGHQKIAVLPIQTVYHGVMPQNVTMEDMDNIARIESQAFQVSLFQEILRSTRRGQRNLSVSLQSWQETLSRLENSGIDILDVYRVNPATLREILEVDALVQGRIQKNRLMSDLASFGIEAGINMAEIISGTNVFAWVPGNATTSKQILADYALTGDNSDVLWSIQFEQQADWRLTSQQIIDNISRRAGRHFPYRR